MKENKHPIKDLYYQYRRKGQYIVNGTINGNVEYSISVLLGTSGTINGNVHVKYADIKGTVNGDITADDYIKISPTAKISGKIHAKEILTTQTIDSTVV